MFLMPLSSPCNPKRNLPGRNPVETEQGKLITAASGWEGEQDGPRHMSSSQAKGRGHKGQKSPYFASEGSLCGDNKEVFSSLARQGGSEFIKIHAKGSADDIFLTPLPQLQL